MTDTLDLFAETKEDNSVSNSRCRENKKSENAYRTISEVAKEIGVATHVLRFWETKFNEIQPLKRGGGRRYYRPEDITTIKNIQNLLHNEGYTIKGVQTVLSKGSTTVKSSGETLPDILGKLYSLRKILCA